ncbi:hypothetical protein HY629_02880 [Candidatus Uhrbacteria bacterium]|nr:hypothetical protein [Candidatus Uhrbacteria bacterium]
MFVVWVVLALSGCAGGPALRVSEDLDDRVPVGYLSADFAREKYVFQASHEYAVANGYLPIDVIEGVGGAILVLTPEFTETVCVALRGEDADGHSKTLAVERIDNGRVAFYPETWKGSYASEVRPTSIVLLFINKDTKDREDAVRVWRTFTFRTRDGEPQQPY